MLPVRIVVTGEPVESVFRERGNFAKLIREAVGDAWPGPWEEVDSRVDDLLACGRDAGAVIVTGSPASVLERAPWMLRTEEYLRREAARGTPILGVCFGHQLLAQALGGEVQKNPNGREMGTVEVRVLRGDAVLDADALPFTANMTHVDSVVKLPVGAEVLGQTEKDPHAVVRFADKVWGVQFHPEITGDVMRGYVRARWEILESEGLDPADLLAASRDADPGRSVLSRFVEQLGRPFPT
ncbi:MAG: glutamine amidotransferase [Polyangiaceae bacterium]|nr:glutamine amidotransferase [Polyangiaceae bacterium]